MRNGHFLRNSRFKLLGILLCITVLTYPMEVKALGWEQTGGYAMYCPCTGAAYTLTTEEFKIFGITLSSREVYRDANNQVLDGNPCSCGGGNAP